MRTNFLGAMLIAAVAGSASADVISFDATAASLQTDADSTISLPLFDDLGGTRILTGVQLTLRADATGRFRAESTDNAPVDVLVTLDVRVVLSRGGTTYVNIDQSLLNTTQNFATFDGDLDYAGTSGRTWDNLAASASDSFSSINPADLALFTGVGNIDFTVARTGFSTNSAAGNGIFIPESSAGGLVTVTYTFIPGAGTLAPMAAGLLIAGRRRR